MPRIPTYDDDQIAPAQTTGARFQAANNGGGVGGALGAGLTQLGGALSAHDDVMADLHRARRGELQAALAHQQIREAVARRRGASVADAGALAEAAMLEARDAAIQNTKSPRERDMLNDVLNHREAVLRHELAGHIEREKMAGQLEVARQRLALARQDAIDAKTPLAFHTNLKTLHGAHDQLAALTGSDPGEVQAAKFRDASSVHAGQILNKLHAGDVENAAAWHAEHEPRLSGADNAQVKAALAEPLAQAASDARVDNLMGKLTRNGNAAFSYADPLHGAGRTPTPVENGVHIPADAGTPVYPTTAGTATVAPDSALTIAHPDGLETRYAGLGDVAVKNGDPVTPDTMLGTVADTESGAGLHYAMSRDGQPVDPASVADRVTQTLGPHDVQALVDAINNHPDPSYTPDQRAQDTAGVTQRMALTSRLLKPKLVPASSERPMTSILGVAHEKENPGSNGQVQGGSSRGQPSGQPDVTITADRGSQRQIDKSHMTDPQWWKWHDDHPDSTDIGILSRKYETRNRGPGFVSSGAGDPGGKSYGAYQLARNVSRPTAFLAAEGARWAPEFRGLTPYTAEWDAKWKLIGARDHDTFVEAQLKYMTRTHYAPVVSAMRTSRNLNIEQMSNGTQNAIFSLTTQMGPGRLEKRTKLANGAVRVAPPTGAILILGRAIENTDATTKRTDPGYERQLIQNLYEARIQFMRRVKARHVRDSLDMKRSPSQRKDSATYAANAQNVIDYRYKQESSDAVRMYDDEVVRFPQMKQ